MEKKIKRKNCTVIYEVQGDCAKIKRSIPDDGVFVFEIQATYAKNVPSSKYYIYGKAVSEARKQFADFFPWLNVIRGVRKITEKNEIEEILTNPMRMPM